jgi:teichuronic acid biosynthesis glycosyltransferase TuaC
VTPTSQLNALVVTNMYPTAEQPALGRFVADQVAALARLDGVSVEVFAFSGGSPAAYARAAALAQRRFRGRHFDVVHAHFGLSAWPALAISAGAHAVTLHGTDLSHPRSRPITLAALPWLDLIGVVSAELGRRVPLWSARAGVQVLPCGVDLSRFRTIPRHTARSALGLDLTGRYVLFPSDPARPEKRFDLAQELVAVAEAAGTMAPSGGPPVQLLSLRNVEPERVPFYVNAANAVVIPSDREGFGLACLEALACEVPVLATPHGIAPEALAGVPGCLCADFSAAAWSERLAPHLAAADPRTTGRESALRFSSDSMAERVLTSWRGLVAGAGVQRRR